MSTRYADVDVVTTRQGIEIIADLNDIPHLCCNKRHPLKHLVNLIAVSKRDKVTITETLKQNVGNIVRIKVEDRKLKTIKKIREINSKVLTTDRQETLAHSFEEHREDRENTFKYIDYFSNNFTLKGV